MPMPDVCANAFLFHVACVPICCFIYFAAISNVCRCWHH